MVDQIIPPTNLDRYLRYFNDIKVAVVDRDPRDIFLLEKYVWKDGVIPSDAVLFCKWFKYTRAHRKRDSFDRKKVRYIQFEDMIYHYEKTKLELMGWLNLEEKEHINKFKYFDPNKSIKNTQIWKKIKYNQNEIKYIENELSEFLYQFQ